jgi:hypothetical protein
MPLVANHERDLPDEGRPFVQRMLDTPRRINRRERVEGRVKTIKRQICEVAVAGSR